MPPPRSLEDAEAADRTARDAAAAIVRRLSAAVAR